MINASNEGIIMERFIEAHARACKAVFLNNNNNNRDRNPDILRMRRNIE